MKRLAQASKRVFRTGVVVGLGLAIVARETLASSRLDDNLVALMLALMVLVVAEVVKWAAEGLLFGSNAASRWLRKKVMGTQHIEGTWVDVVWKDGKNLSNGVTKITTDGLSVRYAGENFDPATGAFMGDFVSEMAAVSWPRMVYTAKSRHHADKSVRTGLGELAFVEKDSGPPLRYNGHFVDIDDDGSFLVQGKRIVEEYELRQLDDPAGRAELLKKFAAELGDQTGAASAGHSTADGCSSG